MKSKEKIMEELVKETAKNIVLHCFRNTHLENIHAGEKNGGVGAGFSDEEMKKLMIESVNNTYTYLSCLLNRAKFKPNMEHWIQINKSSTMDWNEPELVKEWIC